VRLVIVSLLAIAVAVASAARWRWTVVVSWWSRARVVLSAPRSLPWRPPRPHAPRYGCAVLQSGARCDAWRTRALPRGRCASRVVAFLPSLF
jgi:hypothetical protein